VLILLSPLALSEADSSDSDLDILTSFGRQGARHGKSKPRSVSTISPETKSPFAPTFISTRKGSGRMGYDGAGDDSSAGSAPEDGEQKVKKKSKKTRTKAKASTVQPVSQNKKREVVSLLESPTRVSLKEGVAVLPKTESVTSERVSKPKSTTGRTFISGGNSYYAPMMKKNTPSSSNRSNAKEKKGSVISLSDDDEDDDDDDIAVLPTPPSRRSKSDKQSLPKLFDEGDDDLPEISNIKTSLPRKEKGPVKFGEPGHVDETEDDEDIPLRSSQKRRHQETNQTTEDEDDGDEDDDPVISSPVKRRRTVIDDESETDELASPAKRARRRPKNTRKAFEQTNAQTPKRLTRQQEPKRRHRSEREKKLELLKRQRAGEKITELTTSESDSEPRHGLYDSDSDLEVLSTFEDEEENEAIEQVRESLRPQNRDTDGEDDFIVDDADAPLGVPDLGLHDIPLQFTHQAHKPLKEHFKDAIEWLVQRKVSLRRFKE
jgi:hypothetical protein